MQPMKNTNDPNYRYLAPKIKYVHVQNGTMITNLKEISKSINRDEIEIIHFFKKKKGLRVIYATIGYPVFSGRHTDFNNLLLEYFKKYCFCIKCDLPEMVKDTCHACGYNISQLIL